MEKIYSSAKIMEKVVITIISRTPPQSHVALNRFLARLLPTHLQRKEVEKQLNKIDAGYAGEKLVDETILEVGFPAHSIILPDVLLKIHEHLFIQLDTLILTKKYLLIIEVKNIVGSITFPTHKGQVIRTLEGVKTPLECPIAQINRHIHSLGHLQLPLPIYKAIVYSSNRVLLENVPPDQPIFFRKNLPLFIQSLNKKDDKVSTSEFNNLVKKVQSLQHSRKPKALCERWNINPATLIKGLLCKACKKPLSKISNKTWKCMQCEGIDRNPMLHNINDYFFMVKDSITTAECMDFFGLYSTNEAYYMLKKCNLESVNNARKTVYRRKSEVF